MKKMRRFVAAACLGLALIGLLAGCSTNRPLPEPPSGTGTLEDCESRYRELDIRHQLLRQVGVEEDRMDEKLELCKAINRFLKEHKDEYLRRCRQCGRKLPATHPFGVCEQCFRKSYR